MKTASIQKPQPIEPLMSIADIAAVLGVTRRSVERLRSSGSLPKPDLRIGRNLRWRPDTVRTWLDSSSGVI